MPTTDSPTGTLLGDRYLLTRPLGAGASATVYLAEDRSLRREVAVKVLRTGLTHDRAFLRRFRAEAVAVAGLNHPHVLRVFDWGEAGDDAWLVTEYLAGGSVRDLLDLRGSLPLEQVVSIGAQAADGLAYAHERGFVHRDVKPSNLLFDDAGRVRITDFGVARALAEAAWTEPSGGLIGTVRYTSPEQAQGRPVDGKTDVYSLALVLYECATGELPFAADSQVATLNARIGAAPPEHRALGPLAPVLRAALAADPAARLDAEQLLEGLTDLARSLPDVAPPRVPRHAQTVGFRPPTAEELTGQHRAVGARATSHVRSDAPPHEAHDTTLVGTPVSPAPLDATVVGLTRDATVVATVPTVTPATGATPPPSAPPAPRPPRRRWPLLVVALALIAAGTAYGLSQSGPAAKAHFRMPRLRGHSSTADAALLTRYHSTLKVDRYAYSLKYHPGEVMAQRPRPGASVLEGAVVHVIVSAGLPPEPVPVVVGTSLGAAVAALRAAHFTVSAPATLAEYSPTQPAGRVLGVFSGNTDNPSAAPYGTRLALSVSKGPPPIPVPDVVGAPGQTAVGALQRAGFRPYVVHEYSRTVHAGNVIATTPASTQSLQPGKRVTVVVSNGAPATVPSLGELSLSESEQRIIAAGLTVLTYHGPRTAKGWTTEPPAGTVVPEGSSVTLYAKH